MYLSYEDYQQFGGNLDETAFDDICFEATAKIDWYTFGRLKNLKYSEVNENVKRCCYALIKMIDAEMNLYGLGGSGSESSSTGGWQIASQSNDGVSVSYNTLSASESVVNIDKKIVDTINKYLSYVVDELGRKVLYRGLYPGE